VGVEEVPAGGPPRWWRRPSVRARAADAVYLLLGAAATVTDVTEAARSNGLAFAVAAAVTEVLGTVALLWRRSRPLLPVALSVPSIVPAGQLGVFPLAVLALAIRRRDRVLWIVAVAGYVLSIVAAGIRNPDSLGGALISNVLTLGFAMAVGAYIGARRDLIASLRARTAQAEAELALRADQARLAERTRIAQEMHDVLAHRISLIGLHAGGLEVQPDAGPDVVERSAALIRQTARAALDDLRGVLGVLRADEFAEGVDLAPQPQLRDVPRLVESSRAAGVAVTLLDRLPDGAAPRVPELTGRTVYRVIQEALTNVHKHARDAATTVILSGAPGQGLAVEVVNVRPVAADSLLPGAGVGLVGLRERVELSGGTLEAGATPEGGWRVRAWFPWPAT
jgi:signal transduction histidine kinase